MIDFTILERLLGLLDQSDANSIEVRKGFWSTTIRVSKSPLGASGGPVTYQVGGAPVPPAVPGPAPAANPAPAAESAPAAVEHLVDVKSPMVGTFYTQPEPGAEPYVQVGSRISSGQTLCIIEAMKIMNPLEAEVSGVIMERLVDDAQPVEYGQVLFRVDPNG